MKINFSDCGDYAADYAAAAVAHGCAKVVAVTERTEQGFAFFSGDVGPGVWKVRTAKIVATKEGFIPNTDFDCEIEVGSVGYCPAELVGR